MSAAVSGSFRKLKPSNRFFIQSDFPVKQHVKRNLITAIKFALSIAILAYLFNTARQDDQFDGFLTSQKHWGWIALGFLGCLGAHLISFFRWRVMVRALDLPFTMFDAVRIGFISSFFSLFAFGVLGGDTLRAFYVTRQIRDRAPEAICSVIADRVLGLLTMFSFASVAFLMLDTASIASEHPGKLATLNYACMIVLAFTAVGIAGVITVFLSPQIVKTNWYRRLYTLPRIGSIISRLTEVVLVYRSKPGAVMICVLMSVGVNLCFVVSIYSMAAGLTQSYPSLANHFLIEPISMVANAAPLPGGLGGMELAVKFLYEAFSYNTGVIVAFSFRFALLCISALGAVFWFMNRSKVADVIEKNVQNPVD